MRIIFGVLFIFASACAYAAEYASVDSCIERGKQLFAAQNLDKAQEVFLECFALDNKNTDVIISLAGIYLAQNNLPAAKTFFEKAASMLPPDSPYNAYAFSRLGDIYFKHGDFQQAKQAYETSLKFNQANVNSIIGLGVIAEYGGDLTAAGKAYRTALSVEPYNTIARENYRRLEPRVFSDEEVLAALKLRGVAADNLTVLPENGRELFFKIHRAEQSKGVEFLKEKYKDRPPRGMILEINTGTPDLRFLLTLAGYKEVMRLMSMDAVKLFTAAGVKNYEVYQLRDLNGKPVFSADKILTEQGIPVYTQALSGKKIFLMPDEQPPAVAREQNEQIKKLLEAGNVEISVKEYQYILDKTLCSEDTLKRYARVNITILGNTIRRFVTDPDAQKPPITAPNPAFFPYFYAMTYRAQNSPNYQPTYDNFFGSGAAASITLCDKRTGELNN
ncbi:hypothetical protein FACS189437_03970 [Bacteroidia bacterium]|nr:hypothetical protein FACS189437_03970 [Bacteroidia bacterium]